MSCLTFVFSLPFSVPIIPRPFKAFLRGLFRHEVPKLWSFYDPLRIMMKAGKAMSLLGPPSVRIFQVWPPKFDSGTCLLFFPPFWVWQGFGSQKKKGFVFSRLIAIIH